MTFLTDQVCDFIEDNPGSDVDDLMPHFPEHTRFQVMQAMHSMAFKGRLICHKQGALGRDGGMRPGRYSIAPPEHVKTVRGVDYGKPGPRAVSSVWALGSKGQTT